MKNTKNTTSKLNEKQGKINMDLKGFNNDVKGTIELPDQMSGTFKWGKKSIKLISGINQIDF